MYYGLNEDISTSTVVHYWSNHRLHVLQCTDRACLRTIGSKGSGAGQFDTPYGVTFDGSGNIWVDDSKNHRVQILHYVDGSHVRTIGSQVSGNGQFIQPFSIAIDDCGNALVQDLASDCRAQVFRVSDGAYLRTLCGDPEQHKGYRSIALDRIGNVDSINHRVNVLRFSDLVMVPA